MLGPEQEPVEPELGQVVELELVLVVVRVEATVLVVLALVWLALELVRASRMACLDQIAE